MTKVIQVILCGGSGTRLWPLSRTSFPKQFLTFSEDLSGRSLFQQMVHRVSRVGSPEIDLSAKLVVTNEEHRFIALHQLEEFSNKEISLILEPSSRNTAPSLTLAALKISDELCGQDDPVMVVTPSDHRILSDEIFAQALRDCVQIISTDKTRSAIAVLGVTPTAPETGFGYIRRNSVPGKLGEFDVVSFVEKPDFKRANDYLKDGNYLWNSGIFVLRASTWLDAIKEFRPDILSSALAAWNSNTVDRVEGVNLFRPNESLFNKIPMESIDYAVIEKCCDKSVSKKFITKVVELNTEWSDLGSWNSVWESGVQDEDGNVINGDVVLNDTFNSLVYSSDRLVGVVGLNNLVVVETADSVLVADKSSSQKVKSLVSQLAKQQREEKNLHRKVIRPWGWYDTLDQGVRFKVKRIKVNPGSSLSLQMHRHRAEHWIVVKGKAQITNGEQIISLGENQSTFIPQGQAHRLSNPDMAVPLEIIEVQSGDYLGEDDIVRLDDVYGRK